MTGLIGKTPTTIGAVRVLGQLDADVAIADSVARNSDSRGGRPTKTVPSLGQVDLGDLVEIAVQLEPPAQLVQRHVRPRLDEAAQLGGGGAALGFDRFRCGVSRLVSSAIAKFPARRPGRAAPG